MSEFVRIPLPARVGAATAAGAAKKKKKRKYSRAWRSVQELERGVSKGVQRLAFSVVAGIRVWRKSTDKSARKRKDGAIRDALKNGAKAVGRQIRVATWAPLDVLKAVPKLKLRGIIARVFLPFFK